MKIRNETHWRTDHLRAFAQRVAKAELDPPQRRRLRVEVTYNRARGRGGYVSGWAPYHGGRIRIMVPSDTIDRVDLAHTIAHEMAHSRGMNHRQMRKSPRYDSRVDSWREHYAWASELPLDRKPPRPRLTLEGRRQERLERAREALVRWERRIKLATSRARRWRRRVQVLERVMTKAAQKPPAGGL